MKIIAIIIFILIIFSTSYASDSLKVVYTIVALCDNQFQGIVPVPENLGNGQNPRSNLYWGALYGLKTYFNNSSNWKLIESIAYEKDSSIILERVVFKHSDSAVYMVSDAYDGRHMKNAISDFVNSAKKCLIDSVTINDSSTTLTLPIYGGADLIAFIGHNGLMDQALQSIPENCGESKKDIIVLCCFGKSYFSEIFTQSEINPILWTTGLMAPEAYTLKAAIDGWLVDESPGSIQHRAAKSYSDYQKCRLSSAKKLLVTGW